jgi:hypothetical protein
MSESRVRENRTHGSMRRREATQDQSATPRGPRTPPADPTLRQRDPAAVQETNALEIDLSGRFRDPCLKRRSSG